MEIVSFLPKLYFSPSYNDTFQGNLRDQPLQSLTQSFEQIFLAVKIIREDDVRMTKDNRKMK